ncbi:MAG: hypothetical protein CMF22_10620 [Idiomarinaceae bacterium]|nr:hypothetical protein [Idiomarinaceae bacterium]|tara:strand:+ start:7694 stop:8986 length:1293 start_codon:yes stop_codon:yes gene_type:complete
MAKYTKPNSVNTIWATSALGTDIEKPLDSYIQTGWTQVKPPYQYENWSMNKLHQGLAYYNQLGIPEWDAMTEYQAFKSYVQATDNRIYRCIQTHTNKDPSAGNVNFWEVYEGNRQATTQARGTVELATQNEANEGTRTDLAITASTLHNKKATQSAEGIVKMATQAEVSAGTSTNTAISPATLQFRTATTDQSGLVELATQAEAAQGTRDDRALTPESLSGVFQILFPVGSIIMRPTNPGNSIGSGGLGFGTWTKVTGRSIIGDGSYTDPNGTNRSFVAGNSEGEYTHQLTVNEMPAHDHPATTGGAGGHRHNGTTYGAGAHSHSGNTNTAGAHTHPVRVYSDTQGGPLRVAAGGANQGFGDVDGDNSMRERGNHSHGLNINNAGYHTHNFQTDFENNHTHSVNVQNRGGNGYHNNIHPVFVAPIWYRTS